jgi:hypothetical protein
VGLPAAAEGRAVAGPRGRRAGRPGAGRHPPQPAGAGDQPPARVLHPRRRRPHRAADAVTPAPHLCEFKGAARYYDAGSHAAVAWSYPSPSRGYEAIEGHYAFYPGRVDTATVDGEQVEAQPGDFYGGWITSTVTGPFKGGPGTTGW